MFTVLGLETKDEAVYREMLESPALGVEEIAARLATSPDRVRACLDKLFELQLIQESSAQLLGQPRGEADRA
ncbi:hypothetical protein HCK01_13935, partial [Streptomyces sp. AA8]|nr:hypothetical protein [Streptomyces telluris]